ncbi:hypothetical protein M413DRAFT_24088 [Hebeloma cylindrosporum]|uniref:ER membrane protein complex subunit 2 n=1 Tax=Hebeloma cylindrosporum TaxID=76867 RepID=A0A0C3CC27_HEBCY|nr:hypothetical protein M413DRAFT_24088 [Hebeloma cylindrosporum h7]
MSVNNHTFLFSSLDSKQPSTARKVHIRRLYDILQLSIQRHQFQRAKRVWAILVHCKEIDWKRLWNVGLHILSEDTTNEGGGHVAVEYLRSMMLQCPDNRETILKELVFRLLLQGKCRDALDELELYLPSFPYQDNPILHIYAGLSCLYLAQSTSGSSTTFDSILIRDAQAQLEHAKVLDPDNVVAQAFLDKISAIQKGFTDTRDDSDEDAMDLNDHDNQPSKKRVRT